MESLPTVSVICLCHNHAPYVKEAIVSVANQSYPQVELIVVDDGSTDGSKEIIKEIITTDVAFINIEKPIGNCKAFNRGFDVSSGSFIIDLAADDVLLPERISEGTHSFKKHDIGVNFCNVKNIDGAGNSLGFHFLQSDVVPDGNIYEHLIQTYFISPPSMMIKREVLEDLGGYDESLTYEDFDFWIRSSRKYAYKYTNQTLVKKRILKKSFSSEQRSFLNRHQQSTLRVCQKIKTLNRTIGENKALKKRVLYEMKQCIKQGNIHLLPAFLKLLG